jgi:hypothetical protein
MMRGEAAFASSSLGRMEKMRVESCCCLRHSAIHDGETFFQWVLSGCLRTNRNAADVSPSHAIKGVS